MDTIELAVARGKTLEILKAHLDRERPTSEDSLSAYMTEDILIFWLARMGHPMIRNEMRGSLLTYLKDAGLVKYRDKQPGGAKGPTLIFWRITHDGLQVLEGTRSDPGVRVF
jgi:hypothetical protein